MANDNAWAIADQVSKRFFATQALDNVTLHFDAGKVHALVGENGAGKSTLIKLFGGVHRPDSGEIRIDGQKVGLNSPRDALRAGIVVIPQEMRVVESQSVAENVTLGEIPCTRHFGFLSAVDRAAMRRRTNDLLQQFEIELDPDRPVSELAFAERQIIMIARALNHNARFLILDEPTAALETREVDRLFDVVHRLKSLNVAVAFISHHLDEIDAIADQCTILRDGRIVPHSAQNAIPKRDEIVRLMTGRDIEEVHGNGNRLHGEPLLTVGDRGNQPQSNQPRIQQVSVRHGEILGLAGLMGGGMTEFLRTIFGAGAKHSTIQLKEFVIHISSPADAIANGIGMVPRERSQGLIMGMSVRENIVLPNLEKFKAAKGLDNARIVSFVSELINSVDIRPHDPNKIVRELSGGNQQKVIFARWLAGHADLLLLDEPTHGVDVGAKAQIHALMNEFVQKDGGIMFASTEMTEILSVSDNVLAMRAGEIVARISRDGEYNERALRNAMAD